ncbi:MAG TPA: DUF1697 domain-containing protein [Verrucomicrobiae bacterium]|nr:DUF1697 domain-containing protein [Verrucomicrobiae bacterium]
MIYIALLRGVNVGGKAMVSMVALKACFEQLGFTHVMTYINSGNVIFNSTDVSTDTLARRIEASLDQTFDPGIRVLVKTNDELQALAAAIPSSWVNNADMRCDIMFLWREIDKPTIVNELPIKPDIEDVRYLPGAALWRIDRPQITKSRMTRIIGTPLYKQITIRNANTVRKLASLANEIS